MDRELTHDRWYQILERTWMLQHLPWALLFLAWGGVGFAVWGVCGRIVAGNLGHWCIGYLAHNHGLISHEVPGAAVQGRNVRFTSLLTMGECWHNNHHAHPYSAKLGLAKGEWDPGWWVLCGLKHLRLVWDLKLPGEVAAGHEFCGMALVN
jgi:stearoyl-CoA desaturase (delta-9 desaturase)